ncbi:Stress responsive A/B Barrel Domain [Chitinophaga costaii]|uniref:Stress responsive A/B Barrel Domain n=1 Tax=Chitinophaga costaii TaxID=1335309 RepID=A0A1C3YZ44_9BACT|nr:Dabb family protein [Chitinophaga costaii]PUZ30162.1 Dabb family protein [Chitinophaga costaii]SCB75349.1 Stress responsive A/B Barrel Domain [Chitinophaga costaii]
MNTSNRRKFIGNAAALVAGSAIAVASMPAAQHAPIIHHAIFWLKNPHSTADRDKLVEGVKTLAHIPTVQTLHVGILAPTEKRDVVDNTWGVSEIMFFKDLPGQATYQTHPLHLAFIKNYSHLWEKVVVYDAQTV